MKYIDVSIIMSEYNTDLELLEKAIKSILNQTYTNFEFIIIDDCGRNNLKQICEKFQDERIKIIKNKKNEGLVYSLNKAIKMSKGKYIARMDTDDISHQNRIQKQYDFMKKNPQYSVVATQSIEIEDGDKELGIIGNKGEFTRENLTKGGFFIHGSVMMKKEELKNIDYYKNYNRAEDFVLWSELLLAEKKIYIIEEPLYYYRCRKNDYMKRKLKYRKDEIKAKIEFYPKLKAPIHHYFYIIRAIFSGIAPIWLVRKIRKIFVIGVKQ